MAKLIISQEDIIRAIKEYYRDYECDLFRKFNFEELVLEIDDTANSDGLVTVVVEEKD